MAADKHIKSGRKGDRETSSASPFVMRHDVVSSGIRATPRTLTTGRSKLSGARTLKAPFKKIHGTPVPSLVDSRLEATAARSQTFGHCTKD